MDIKIWDGGYFYSFVGKYYPQLDYKTEFKQPKVLDLPAIEPKEGILLVSPDVETSDLLRFRSTKFLLSKCSKKYSKIERVELIHERYYPFNQVSAKLPLYIRYNYLFGDKNQVLEEYKGILKRSYQKTLSQQVGKETRTTTVLELIKSTIKEYIEEGTRIVLISAERNQEHSFKNVLVNSLRENGIIVEKLWD